MSKRKRYGAEEIIAKLLEAEVHLAQGWTIHPTDPRQRTDILPLAT